MKAPTIANLISEMRAVARGELPAPADAAVASSEPAALKADIDKGLADLAEGRVKDFDVARIIERGRKLLASRLPPT